MTEQRLNWCGEGGWVVGARLPVPADPADFWVQPMGATVGCNRLRCRGCGEWVQAAADEVVRRYACACTRWDEVAAHLMDPDDRDPACDPELPWRCGGHPIAELPVDVDGLRVEADLDLEALIAEVVDGRVPPSAQAHHRALPAEWLCRLYARLAGLPLAEQLAERIAARMLEGDALARGAGLLFFHRFPDAPGSQAVQSLAERDAGRGLTETSPVRYGEGWLAFSPLQLLRRRLGEDGDEARRTLVLQACQRALLAGASDPDALRTLAAHDADWLAVHAAELVRARPESLHGLLDLLLFDPQEQRLVIAGIALVEAADLDPQRLEHWLLLQGRRPLAALQVLRQALARRAGSPG